MLPGRRQSVLAATSLALALGASLPLVGARPAAAWDAGAFDSASERQLVALTNATRREAGLRPLTVDARLGDVARWRSRDMVDRAYFSHDIPGGSNVFDELSRRRFCFELAGENIGWNTWADDEATAGIHGMFLDSPGHRRNVVGRAWDVVGIGAYKGADGRKVWTVLFADACRPVGLPDQPPSGSSTMEARPGPVSVGSGPWGVGDRAAAPSSAVLGALERIGRLALDTLRGVLAVGTIGLGPR